MKDSKLLGSSKPQHTNQLGQPVGAALPDWKPVQLPGKETISGRFCRIEPLNPEAHAQALYSANSLDIEGRMWTYLPYGPFETFSNYLEWMQNICQTDNSLFYAIFDLAADKAVGLASYMEISPNAGSIEVGHLAYSPWMQQTIVSTEAMYLMMKNAFRLGYRRYQWRCNALNAPSCAAAQRLGLSYEGIFRQANVIKGLSRDTAWFAAIDAEWPAIQGAFLRWLSPDNFDENGIQKVRLSDLTGSILKQRYKP
ncbi:acetyltransferase (GNAT) domain protein [Leptospira santarosai str. CBC1416]|uniref:GNAT family acetyltransferase n=2 Tax=Leptospira santarosai TaxID=28183 RepID=K8Y671_9LEPT|nr:GNAT family protein [Leptospira santarosai]EMO57009.1 acetyltransferase (GNAT) domain protein [Leptospira santarosai str. CBC1416]EKS09144.1 acetyltransferase (GNAT) domain protein [Leptospira santarosai str. JET]EKT88451.1 GNAT family acetyltransferase [Leptospira santarosai serovar Shermani str. LT 821]EMO13121.1 acetyltransferase (GNAT) domain protein [Leptospira santarosai str. CBC523]EPG84203.1 acetyltransferase (GNAT) domain protein [Leptospira santarosai serovar Shermani str. 1342KT]